MADNVVGEVLDAAAREDGTGSRRSSTPTGTGTPALPRQMRQLTPSCETG